MIQGQKVDEWTKAQRLRVLRHSREKDARRWRHAERRRVMLRQMIRVETRSVVLFDDLQALFVQIGHGTSAAIEMIEDSELQFFHLRTWAAKRRLARTTPEPLPL